MLRRLITLLLAFACVFTLALPAHETTSTDTTAAKESCCCGPDTATPCADRDCTPQPCTASTPRTTAAASEQQSPAAKPSARASRRAFAAFLSLFSNEKISAATARASFSTASRVAPADSVALYQAHCSLLI